MLKEFKEFAMRGNVVDMAVGIIIQRKGMDLFDEFPDRALMPLSTA